MTQKAPNYIWKIMQRCVFFVAVIFCSNFSFAERVAYFNTAGLLTRCELLIQNIGAVEETITSLSPYIFENGQATSASFSALRNSRTINSVNIPYRIPAGEFLVLKFDFGSTKLLGFGGSFKVSSSPTNFTAAPGVKAQLHCYRKNEFRKSGSYLVELMGGRPF